MTSDPTGVVPGWRIRLAGSQDGVPGVTQNTIAPGASYTYRFTVPDAGMFWYDAHQDASTQVARGLYGPLVVLPSGASASASNDFFYSLHTYARGGGGPRAGRSPSTGTWAC